ncbi:response regulator [Litorilinea aerophila]|uniref:Circadian input-output histidine kinase CikA n=1 Tax=Litorilinea aerophila TaxID=1204385 RepID=A0A540VCS7_9CHLR|nr:ATP-binding protein [Litorilinea aerophila]MCC9077592.1 response regulator [Litorilinea aerophila]
MEISQVNLQLPQYRVEVMGDLHGAMLRRVLALVMLVAWVTAAPFSGASPSPAFVLCLATMGLGLLGFWILAYSYWLAATTLLVGLTGLGLWATWLYPSAPLPLFFHLTVAIAVFTLGPAVGFVSAAVMSALLLYAMDVHPANLSVTAAWIGILLCWLSFLLTWQGTKPMRTLTLWSWHSHLQARQRAAQLEEVQAKLQQTLKSLDAAYQELAKTNRKLAVSKAIVEEARQAKAEFVANVSHELRTPINMITGFTEMILRAPRTYARNGLPPALLADLDVVFRNAQHLSELINDILDLSQLDVGRMGLVREWARMPEIAEAAAASIRPLAEAKGLSLRVDMEPDLPAAFMDATRVRQILLNLLSNAVRFTEVGHVILRVSRHRDQIVVSVCDTGPGVAPHDIAKLFEPFRQVDGSARRRMGGTGLGLHISRRFARLHGGDLTVESEVGRGTTFHLSLPIDNDLDLSPVGHSTAPDALLLARKSAPYIVVEPQPLLERLLRRYLDHTEVLAVPSIQEAMALSRSQPIQGIVLRTTHQRESLSLLQEAKKMVCDAPLIVCAMPGSLEAYSQERGLAGYLLKPLERTQLMAILARFPHARTLLLVDDDRDFRHLFSRMLKTADREYILWQAMGAEEALAILKERQPDLLFLDVLLPHLDGPWLLDHIRAQPELRDLPVFFITAQDASGSPLVASLLEITHRGGLSADELMRCIQAVGQAFTGAIPPVERATEVEDTNAMAELPGQVLPVVVPG